MRTIAAFLRFWYRFIIGDDWRIAAGVTITLALTAALAHTGVAAWWITPLGALTILTASLRSKPKADKRRPPGL